MNPRRRGRLGVALALAAAAVGLMGPASADAAVTVGPSVTAPLNGSYGCSPCTALNLASSSAQLASPIDGVVVRYRLQKAAPGQNFGTVSLRVMRPVGGGAFTGAGTSPGVSAQGPPTLREVPVQLPIQAGDYIGVNATGPQLDYRNAVGSTLGVFNGGLADGSAPMVPSNVTGGQEFPIQADIEPDADNDGFGDETQDCNASNGSATTDCAPPDTTITSGPKDKTKKKSATFEFSGSDARAVAGFECSFDGAPYAACSSPLTVKVKKGKHTFSVRAVDDSTNADGTPATDNWKVKKKRKKKK